MVWLSDLFIFESYYAIHAFSCQCLHENGVTRVDHSAVDENRTYWSGIQVNIFLPGLCPLLSIFSDRELDCLKILSSILMLLVILLTYTTSEFLRPSSHKLILSYSSSHLYFQSFLKLHRCISTYLVYWNSLNFELTQVTQCLRASVCFTVELYGTT